AACRPLLQPVRNRIYRPMETLMARVLKWILIAAAALVVLLIAAVVAVVVLVDPNDYKDQIAQAVEQQTGRTLTIEGDLDLTFFPWLGLKLGRAQLSDAPGFGD